MHPVRSHAFPQCEETKEGVFNPRAPIGARPTSAMRSIRHSRFRSHLEGPSGASRGSTPVRTCCLREECGEPPLAVAFDSRKLSRSRGRIILRADPPSLILLKKDLEEEWKAHFVPEEHCKLFLTAISRLPPQKAGLEGGFELAGLRSGSAPVSVVMRSIREREDTLEKMLQMSNCGPNAKLKQDFLLVIKHHRKNTRAVLHSLSTWFEAMAFLYATSDEERIPQLIFYWKHENYVRKMNIDTFFLTQSLWTPILNGAKYAGWLEKQLHVPSPPPQKVDLFIRLYVNIQFQAVNKLLQEAAGEILQEIMLETALQSLFESKVQQLLVECLTTVLQNIALTDYIAEAIELGAAQREIRDIIQSWLSEDVGKVLVDAAVDCWGTEVTEEAVCDYSRKLSAEAFLDLLRELLGEATFASTQEEIARRIAEETLTLSVNENTRFIAFDTLLCELLFDCSFTDLQREVAIDEINELAAQDFYYTLLDELSAEIVEGEAQNTACESLITEELCVIVPSCASEVAVEELGVDLTDTLKLILLSDLVEETTEEYFAILSDLITEELRFDLIRQTAMSVAAERMTGELYGDLLDCLLDMGAVDTLVELQLWEEMLTDQTHLVAAEFVNECLVEALLEDLQAALDDSLTTIAIDWLSAFQLTENLTQECSDADTLAIASETMQDVFCHLTTAEWLQELIEEWIPELFQESSFAVLCERLTTDLFFEFSLGEIEAAVTEAKTELATTTQDIWTDELLGEVVLEEFESLAIEQMEADCCNQLLSVAGMQAITGNEVAYSLYEDMLAEECLLISIATLVESETEQAEIDVLTWATIETAIHQECIAMTVEEIICESLPSDEYIMQLLVSEQNAATEEAMLAETIEFVFGEAALECIAEVTAAARLCDELYSEIVSECVLLFYFPATEFNNLLSGLLSEIIKSEMATACSVYELPLPSLADINSLNSDTPLEMKPMHLLEQRSEQVLAEVFRITDGVPLERLESEDKLLIALKGKKETVWYSFEHNGKFLGLLICYQEPDGILVFRHLSVRVESLFCCALTKATDYMCTKFPFREIRVVIARPRVNEEENRILGRLQYRCLSDAIEGMSVVTKERSQRPPEDFLFVDMKISVSVQIDTTDQRAAGRMRAASVAAHMGFLRIPTADGADFSGRLGVVKDEVALERWTQSPPRASELKCNVQWLGSEARLFDFHGLTYEAVRFRWGIMLRVGSRTLGLIPTSLGDLSAFFLSAEDLNAEDLFLFAEEQLRAARQGDEVIDFWVPKFELSGKSETARLLGAQLPDGVVSAATVDADIKSPIKLRPEGQLLIFNPPETILTDQFLFGLVDTRSRTVPLFVCLVSQQDWLPERLDRGMLLAEAVGKDILDEVVKKLIISVTIPECVGTMMTDELIDCQLLTEFLNIVTDAIVLDHLPEDEIFRLSSEIFDTNILSTVVIDELIDRQIQTDFLDIVADTIVLNDYLLEDEIFRLFSEIYSTNVLSEEILSDIINSLLGRNAYALFDELTIDFLVDALIEPIIRETVLDKNLSDEILGDIFEDQLFAELAFEAANTAVSELPIAYSMGIASDSLLERLASEPTATFQLASVEVLESHLEEVLTRLFDFIPQTNLSLVETPPRLMATMQRGIDPRWLWVKFDGKIIGLATGYRDPSLPQIKCFTFRHISALNAGLYYRVVRDSAAAMFKIHPYDEVRVAISKEELSMEEKRVFGEMGFKLKSYNQSERVSILGMARPDESRSSSTHTDDAFITASCEVKLTSGLAVSTGALCSLTLSARPGFACILSALFKADSPLPSNSLQSSFFDPAKLPILASIPYWTMDALRAVLKKAIIWPGSETRKMKIAGARFETTRFISQEKIEGRLGAVEVYKVATETKDLHGFFITGRKLLDNLDENSEEDLYLKTEKLLRESDFQPSSRIPELWVPKFRLKLTSSVEWLTGVVVPGGQQSVSQCVESLQIEMTSKQKVLGQVPVLLVKGMRITKPFLFGLLDTRYPTSPLFVVLVNRGSWVPANDPPAA